tara:strand:- start:6 stop:221 length:216 start_codon:yes stop_codon:yes gene_type:complete
MTQSETEERRELKKELVSLEAKLSRREENIEDLVRNEHYLKSVILGLEEDKRIMESKNTALMKSIDREMIS